MSPYRRKACLSARMSTPCVPNAAALEAEGASENVS
jgi:hypothetical protein